MNDYTKPPHLKIQLANPFIHYPQQIAASRYNSSLSRSASYGCSHHHWHLQVLHRLSTLLEISRIECSLIYVPTVFLLFPMYSAKVYNPTSSNSSFLSGYVHSPVWSFFLGQFFLAIQESRLIEKPSRHLTAKSGRISLHSPFSR